MSEILVDNLTGKTSAGSITVYGEGGTVTQSLQQGLAKAWAKFDASSGTPTANDSFNLGSFTDTATGRHTFNFTNNMGSAGNYVMFGGSSGGEADGSVKVIMYDETAAVKTAAGMSFMVKGSAGPEYDETDSSIGFLGDLA